MITRAKQHLAFAKVVETRKNVSLTNSKPQEFAPGTTFNVVLPKTAKFVNDFALLKIKGRIIFVKLGFGAKLGDKVEIQISKLGQTFAIAHVTKLSPISKIEKQLQIKTSVQKMLKSGLHFGEKAEKCHAKMKKFIWSHKKGQQKTKPLVQRDRHLINVLKTRQCLNLALKKAAKYAAKGHTFFFVGTKKPAAGLVARAALLTKTSFFVNTRWLGGMLTNWQTILKSISKIRPILKEKQRIMKTLLEKRQRIQNRLMLKVQQLKQKSQILIKKGQILITKVKTEKNDFLNQTTLILKKREQLLERGKTLLQKQNQIILQRKEIFEKSTQLQEKANLLITRKKYLITQFMNSRKKLRELQILMLLSIELKKMKNQLNEQGKNVLTISSSDFSKLQSTSVGGFMPNPPKEILNKLIATMRDKYELKTASNALMLGLKAEGSSQTIVFSKLLNRFTQFLPYLTNSIQTLKAKMQFIQTLLEDIHQNLELIQNKLIKALDLTKRCTSELKLIQTKFGAERQYFQLLRYKLQKISAEQRLLRFLPKLRCLPTPESRLNLTVQLLMKKFVDPKMIYPIDKIYDQKIQSKSKKIAATRKKKWQRLEKYFGGVTKMAKMKNNQIQQNVAIIIGQREEMNAVLECQKIGMKMISIVDTNCNPGLADYVIPANDDSRNAIQYILTKLVQHIRLAQQLRHKVAAVKTSKKMERNIFISRRTR
jgi:small subunit ribosomal protein S2